LRELINTLDLLCGVHVLGNQNVRLVVQKRSPLMFNDPSKLMKPVNLYSYTF